MKRLITTCLVCVLLTTTASQAMYLFNFDENGHGYYFDDSGMNYGLPWGVDTPPFGHETLYYILPFTPVNEGDLLVMEPIAAAQIISDVLRFINVPLPTDVIQARIYVYSDLPEEGELPPYDLADTGIPKEFMSATVSVNEVGNEGYNYADYEVPGFATYHFISDVPEPATMALLGLGSLVLLRKRRA